MEHRNLYEQIKWEKRNQIVLEEEEKELGKERKLQLTPLARQIAIALEEGQIKTREEFDKFAKIFGAIPLDMVKRVREFNRGRGVNTKLNDYFSKDDKDRAEEKLINSNDKHKIKKTTSSIPQLIPSVLSS